MILEAAYLSVRPEATEDFERDFALAAPIISSMDGYRWHQLQRCHEVPNRYLLLVGWDSIESHTVGFRGSPDYARWRDLLHHHYDPFPTVEHFVRVHP